MKSHKDIMQYKTNYKVITFPSDLIQAILDAFNI